MSIPRVVLLDVARPGSRCGRRSGCPMGSIAEDGAGPSSASRVSGTEAPGDAEGAGLLGQRLGAGRDLLAGHDQLDHAAAGAGRRVDHHGPGVGQRAGQRGERLVGQAVADLAGLGVAVRARRRRPRRPSRRRSSRGRRCGPSRARPGRAGAPATARRRQEQGAQRLGPALEGPLGPRRGALHVDPVGRHAHEHVGPGPRAQLALPRGSPSVGAPAR